MLFIHLNRICSTAFKTDLCHFFLLINYYCRKKAQKIEIQIEKKIYVSNMNIFVMCNSESNGRWMYTIWSFILWAMMANANKLTPITKSTVQLFWLQTKWIECTMRVQNKNVYHGIPKWHLFVNLGIAVFAIPFFSFLFDTFSKYVHMHVRFWRYIIVLVIRQLCIRSRRYVIFSLRKAKNMEIGFIWALI